MKAWFQGIKRDIWSIDKNSKVFKNISTFKSFSDKNYISGKKIKI